MAQRIAIERVDHIGIRVRELGRALAFYGVLGFELVHRAEGDDVVISRNEHDVELNLVFNANAGDPAGNILMDGPEKFPGHTHIALRVASIPASIARLNANDIAITQGPVAFGESGHVPVLCATPIATSSNCAAATRPRSRALLRTCHKDCAAARRGAHLTVKTQSAILLSVTDWAGPNLAHWPMPVRSTSIGRS